MDKERVEKSTLDWYAVKLLYEYKMTGEPDPETIDEEYNSEKYYEENIILVKAKSFENALDLAESKAKENEFEYTNQYGEKVNYVLVKVMDCIQSWDEDLETGTEIYYRILRVPKELSKDAFLDRFFPKIDAPHSRIGCGEIKKEMDEYFASLQNSDTIDEQ